MHFGSFDFSFRQHVKTRSLSLLFISVHWRETLLFLFFLFRCLLKKPESDKTAEDKKKQQNKAAPRSGNTRCDSRWKGPKVSPPRT